MDFCQRVTRSGAPCTTPVFFGEPVCDEHASYPDGRPTDDPSGRLCAASNADGSPCDQPRLRGHTLCRYHEIDERQEREAREFQEELQARIRGKSEQFAQVGRPDDAFPEMMRSDALECALDENQSSRAHHPRRCAATTKRGKPCRVFALQGEDRCLNHFGAADTFSASQRATAASIIARRTPSDELLNAVLSLTDRASIQALLDTTLRLVLSGRLPNARANLILRGAAIALRNFDRPVDTITGPKPQRHDWHDYFEKVKSLLATIDPLLTEAAQHDATEAPDTFDDGLSPPTLDPSPPLRERAERGPGGEEVRQHDATDPEADLPLSTPVERGPGGEEL